jgi:hypothetical protein
VNALASESRRVAAALFYLQANSLAGALRARLRRLRQPKYLLGALLFFGYFAMVLGGPARQAQRMSAMDWPPEVLSLLSAVIGLLVLVWVLVSWLLPDGRDALRFSEAEVAFLFPAPVSRIGLVNFALLRAQLAIFASAFLLSLLFGRGRGLPGNPLQHATALWLLFANLRLHGLGASFTMSRYADTERGWTRRIMFTLGVLALLAGSGWWLATHLPPPPAADSLRAFVQWLLVLRESTPIAWVLAPFELLAAPLVRGGEGWWRALLPALGLLLVQYLWVVRANVAFEEAAIAGARKRAERAEAFRAGRMPWSWPWSRRARNAPFALRARGPVAIAFLWSGLIRAGGGFWRPRNIALIAFATFGLVFGVSLTPWQRVLDLVGSVALTVFAMSAIFAPMMVQRRLRETLDSLDIYKAGPLDGTQIALGELLTPALLSALGQWFALFVAVLCMSFGGFDGFGGGGARSWMLIGAAALVAPPLVALTICIPFAWVLWFPAWAGSLGTRGGGFEAAGQRMIFSLAYIVLALIALAPAALIGGLAGWLAYLLGAADAISLLAGALLAACVLLVELAGVLRVLGWRIDRFDLSSELR